MIMFSENSLHGRRSPRFFPLERNPIHFLTDNPKRPRKIKTKQLFKNEYFPLHITGYFLPDGSNILQHPCRQAIPIQRLELHDFVRAIPFSRMDGQTGRYGCTAQRPEHVQKRSEAL